MPRVILDTSSLIALAIAEREEHVSQEDPYAFFTKQPAIEDSYAFWTKHPAIFGAIESLILYDEILLDGPSVDRNLDLLSRFKQLRGVCRTIPVDRSVEGIIYRSVIKNYLAHIAGSAECYAEPVAIGQWREFIDTGTYSSLSDAIETAAELGFRPGYLTRPSADWGNIEEALDGDALGIVALEKWTTT